MRILGIQKDHNSSACLFIDKELIYYNQEERLSRKKKDSGLPIQTLFEICKLSPTIDVLLISGYDHIYSECLSIVSIIEKLGFKLSNNFEFIPYYKSHHLTHAALAFYNSKFQDALVMVCDGHGSNYNLSNGGQADETTSIFSVSYPDQFKLLYRRFSTHAAIDESTSIIWDNSLALQKTPVPNYLSKNTDIEIRNDFDLGRMYEGTSRSLGFDDEGGKMMSLQSFGDIDQETPPVLQNNKFNMSVFAFDNYNHIGFNTLVYEDLNNNNTKLNFAAKVQDVFQTQGLKLIKTYLDKSNHKNIILSGGTSLNVVANNYYKNNLPSDINLYIEPMCGDEGNCLGICRHFIYNRYKPVQSVTPLPIYIGGNLPSYDYKLLPKETEIQNVDEEVIAGLLEAGHVVGLFQGRSEGGPRALGNRSLLYDPRVKNGKDIVNNIKGREEFRPFAAAVLQECASDWFDLKNINCSPHMMYAVDYKENMLELVPAVAHVDGTCRIQTVSKKDNKFLYLLINKFFKKTQIPMVLNTSFNLAGDPIVETVNDALDSLRRSKLEYLWLPDVGKLIIVRN
jgi:carbamoyltransferase